jgi:SPOR domain
MYEPVYGGGAVARPGSIEGGRQITVTAHDQIERAVEEMRAQFLTISGQIADELTRLTQHVATASPSVRERVVSAALQIVSTQHFLRAESERLPSDPHERYNIMESVLQAQQGALHQLAIIVMQHAPGWYPNLAQTAGWHSTVSNAAPPWSPPPTPGGEVNGSSGPAPSYPSPPTVQDLATHGWPQAPGNGYRTDVQPPPHHYPWPMGSTGAMVSYPNPSRPETSMHAPWPGRRGQAAGPSQYEPRELRPVRTPASSGAQLPATRKRSEVVAYESGSNNLLWVGLVALALIFIYLSFPGENKHGEAVVDNQAGQGATQANSGRVASSAEAAPPQAAAEPPAAPSAPPQTRMIARAAEAQPSPPSPPPRAPAPAASGMILPGGLVTGSFPGTAVGTFSPEERGPSSSGREVAARSPPALEEAEPPSAPPTRTQRTAPSRVEPEAAPPPAAQAAPRGDRFVAVLFTAQQEPAVAKASARLRQQYPDVLGDRKIESEPVRIARKGVWHRLVVLPAGSRQEAADLCGELIGAGYPRCWIKPYH